MTLTRPSNQQHRCAVALLLVTALLFAACAGSATVEDVASPTVPTAPATSTPDEPTQPPATQPAEPTVEEVELTILDATFLQNTIESQPVSSGALHVVTIDANGTVAHASKGTDDAGVAPLPDDTFRVGSVTKIFTALLVMSLVDEGSVDLDTPAAQYLSRLPVPDGVTVRQLLQHRSGIFNYTDRASFFPEVMADPDRVWSPEEIQAAIADQEALFEPDARFSYSNTNYLLLGVLIEEVTGEPYHQVLRARILEPFNMSSTYVAGVETGPEPFDPFSMVAGVQMEYTSIATSAWAAGAIVSSAPDIHALFVAMFDQQIVSADALAEMTAGVNYGLGLQLETWSSGVTGHNGGIPGYVTLVRHAPETGITLFAVSTETTVPTSPAIASALERALINYPD